MLAAVGCRLAAATMTGKYHIGLLAIAGWVLVTMQARPAGSFETDQYLALDIEIEDSAAVVNKYLNDELEGFLERPSVGRLECKGVVTAFYRSLFRGLLASRLQRFLKSEPRVDRFPDGLRYRDHLRRSIYRKPWFPFILPLSPTIRIGEVRFGLDKIGHLFGFGRRYYKQYERLRARGLSDDEAVRRVVRRGLQQERFFVGGWADGVFSHGDLEANYQGMKLAMSFCRGEDRVLERAPVRWHLRRRIDLRNYVTPSFDESYNNSHYPGPRWKRVRPILIAEYCDSYFSPAVQARMKRYQEIDRPNPSKRVIEAYFVSKGRDPQGSQAMRSICNRPTGPAFTRTAVR